MFTLRPFQFTAAVVAAFLLAPGVAAQTCTSEPFTGSISPNSTAPGGTYALSCNYGSAAYDTPYIASPGCTWTGWSGYAAQFNCTASTTPGTYPISCYLSGGGFCTETNLAGNLTVNSSSGGRGTSGMTETMGQTSVLPYLDSGNANLVTVQQATLSQSGTLRSLSLYTPVAAGSVILGVYDMSGAGGGPGNLLATTNTFTPVSGWNTANVTSPVTLAAGTYWLAYEPSSNALFFMKSSIGTSEWMDYSFGALPGAFGAVAGSGTSVWSFYATLTVASGGGGGGGGGGSGGVASSNITWGPETELFSAGDIGAHQADNNPGTIMINSTSFDWFFTAWGGADAAFFQGPSTQPNQTTLEGVSNGSYTSWINMNGVPGLPWIVGIYKDDSTGNLYGLIHLELDVTDGTANPRTRLAIATSTDGGLYWNVQGNIIIQYDECYCGATQNIGGSGLVVNNGYMYTWFIDNGDNTATARAALSDVLAGNTNAWYKYYNGSYSQPGLGGSSTPLNVWIGHHTSVSFNTYLNQYIVAMAGMPGTPLTLYFSNDGLTWGNPIAVTPDNGMAHWYTVITSPGYKEGISGQVFDVSYWNPTQPTQSTSDEWATRHFTLGAR